MPYRAAMRSFAALRTTEAGGSTFHEAPHYPPHGCSLLSLTIFFFRARDRRPDQPHAGAGRQPGGPTKRVNESRSRTDTRSARPIDCTATAAPASATALSRRPEGCGSSGSPVANRMNQLQRLPIPTSDHSAGDLIVPPVHPELARRRRLVGRTWHCGLLGVHSTLD